MIDADFVGRFKKRFRWSTLRFEWGRWYFQTNALGETLYKFWEWERP